MRPVPHVRHLAALGLAVNLAVGALPTAALVGTAQVAQAADIHPLVQGIKPLSHEVYGYLPYWRLDPGTAGRLRYDLISTIAFFGLGIKATGALDTAWIGYREYVGDDAAAVSNAAHDHGVRVVPTFQLFDSASGAPKMSAFLGSATAQSTFISQALALMALRKADGAGLDFEPVGALAAHAPQYVAFVARFRKAIKARFPAATLVVATSAGATQELVQGVAPYVDRQMVMTYNYHWAGSKVTGPIAPLDNATRTVKLHISRIVSWVPAGSILMGVPYYGYDWPVTSAVPNATVQSNKTTYGPVTSVTYAGARDFLAAHPTVVRHYDALQGSGYYTYWSSTYKTYRQVYFEDERSLSAKYDYAISMGLAGVGIWTTGNDAGYDDLWNVLRAKFYAPVHALAVLGSAVVSRSAGYVYATVHAGVRNSGNVPERGRLGWRILDRRGRLVSSKAWAAAAVYPGHALGHTMKVRLGPATMLAAGTYSLWVRFDTSYAIWRSRAITFRQPY